MTKALEHYRQLERRLWMVRWRHEGEESLEEDAILDEMERPWMDLSEDERALLRLEGPRCWPTDSSSLPPRFSDSLCPSAPTPWAYEGFHSPDQAILSADAS
jgi:hypothetical protein